jgi:hypothetical protein
MDASRLADQLTALRINLLAGLRVMTGRRVSRHDFVYSLDQGLLLLLFAIGFDIAITFVNTEQPASFSTYGLNYLGAIYLLDLLLILLIGRLAGAGSAAIGHLLIISLAMIPTFILAINLIEHAVDHAATNLTLTWALWLLPLVWQLFFLARMLILVLDIKVAKSVGLAVLNVAISLSSLWWLPHSELWYNTTPADEDSPYSELSKLSIEDLFYDQYDILHEDLMALDEQRPNMTDLYLLAVGGYGLENVFLNEVRYVQDLFDRRFDTYRRSLILVNNPATVNDYPMANRHNLQDALQGIADKMDVQEDILFLFMTSHGSRNHRFSVDLGPVPLDDLSPQEVRQAMDDVGIRWRVIVISSCYSGGFIEPLKDPNTLIITAAAADRKSFGCGAASSFTDFGTAYFKHALEQEPDFIQAFDLAASWIEDKEQRENRHSSLPQRHVGQAIREKLSASYLSGQYDSGPSSEGSYNRACNSISEFTRCQP